MGDSGRMHKSPTHTAATQGFTLVEVMMAAFVLVTVLLGTLTGLLQGFAMLDTARNTTLAAQIIQSEIEDLRLQPWDKLPASGGVVLANSIGSSLDSAEVAALARRFSVTRSITDAGRTDADGASTFKRVTFSISWRDYNNRSHTRSYETALGKNGLSDYFAATHNPNTP